MLICECVVHQLLFVCVVYDFCVCAFFAHGFQVISACVLSLRMVFKACVCCVRVCV